MSSPRWTPEQQAAIELRGQILVAAAAGSGKTAVLVERLIRRIMDPDLGEDVDRFLVVTFTKAAANEMRERIGQALDNALFQETDSALTERLLQQRSLLSHASITTLHSFCLELLRQNFYEINLDPAFRVADEAEADLIRQDAMMELFESRYALDDKGFQTLVDAFGSDRNDEPLMDKVLELHQFASSQPDPSAWLERLHKSYVWQDEEELIHSPWGKVVCSSASDRVKECLTLFESALYTACLPDGPIQYIDVLNNDIDRLSTLERALRAEKWSEAEEGYKRALAFPDLPRAAAKSKRTSESELQPSDKERQKELREASKKDRDEGKSRLKGMQELFGISLADQLLYLRSMSEPIHALAVLTQDFEANYTRAKRLRNVVDYSDLEHLALKILLSVDEPTPIALKLQEYYTEVLVDEYQDINAVQERILQLVSREDALTANRFMVGDVKQSIYRFRMADPRLFIHKYAALEHWQPQAAQRGNFVVDLNKNFRSRSEVLDGVNFLFRQIMTEGAGEIAYDDQAALCLGADFISGTEVRTAEGPVELHLFDPQSIRKANSVKTGVENNHNFASENENSPEAGNSVEALGEGSDATAETEDSAEDLETVRIEARIAATRIQEMVLAKECQVYDKELKNFRWIQYSDIVVLMRAYSSVAPIFLEEFQSAGIPVYAETSSGYFGQSEVETVLALLKIIDNPRQDIPLAAVLRSPLVGLDGAQLGIIRALLPQGDFYEALALACWASRELPLVDSNTLQETTLQETSVAGTDFALVDSGNAESASQAERLQNQKFIEIPDLQPVQEIQKDPSILTSPDDSEFADVLILYSKQFPKLLVKAKKALQRDLSLQDKVNSFWLKLQSWRQLASRISLAELIWTLYEETGYLSYVGTLPSGAQRQANLQVLYDRAARYEATNYRGLFRFLRFLEKFQVQGKDMGTARILSEKENVVRLMTVHSSKGLEYPVVLLTGLGKNFNRKILKEQMLLHSQLGIGVPLLDIDNRVSYPSFIHFALKQQLWRESLAEELRILYVALTRAKERLILFGSLKKLEENLQRWQRLATFCRAEAFEDSQLRGAVNYLDWIGPALARHAGSVFRLQSGLFSVAEDSWQLPSDSQWRVVVHETLGGMPTTPELDTAVAEGPELRKIEQPQPLAATDYYEAVERCLAWEYPYQHEVKLAEKTNISELKRQISWHSEEESLSQPGPNVRSENDLHFSSPQFIRTARTLSPAERGIAFHTVMQHLPLGSWGAIWHSLSLEEKHGQIQSYQHDLIGREILSEEQMRTVPLTSVLAVMDSPLGQRLLTCSDLRRELPFSLSVIPPGQQKAVLIQGIIDALLISQQEGKAEIVDFKTDRLDQDPDPEMTLFKRYAFQLAVYAKAVKELLGISNLRCTLYSVSLQTEIPVPNEIVNELFEA